MLQEYEFNSPELKKIWMGLYRDNPYLFPFSSYEYNHQVYAYKKFKLNNYLKKIISWFILKRKNLWFYYL